IDVEFIQTLFILSSHGHDRVLFYKETCQSFHNDGLPSPELRWVDLIFGSNLSNGFLFFQQLLDHLGFKAGCMLSFRVHALIVSCSPSFFGLVLWVHHISIISFPGRSSPMPMNKA